MNTDYKAGMLFHIRTNLDLYYRLFFVGLFLLFGVISLAIVVLENYIGISLLPLESEMERQALVSVLSVMGIVGICFSLLILYFMREKRRAEADRRQQSVPLEVTDERRINIDDRRNAPQ